MMRFRLTLLIFFSSLIIACSHTYRFKPNPDIKALSGHPLAGKRIALDLSKAPTEFKSSAGGHSYHITGIRDQAEHISRNFFSNDQLVSSGQEADVILSLSLNFNMSSIFGGVRCESSATWEIREPAGSVLASGTAKGESSIPTMQVGGNNCEIAALDATGRALDNAFAKMK
jgi:hypothetical protein